ncbi:SLC13 family permease [Amycolatopsis alkalitolerans]|uniref:C4-dicarboxylate ABC transporter n=1 Tax=Amycolatopsis alkalitolerans TaxID=2547244 RepID=A0A5C4M3N3_9PSEU|nr:SLC13 family permease [Amycolatopsis alkalitolerans]TNC25725.1 C4-dicarboxylate ABC transporter [Amycolatopsis alkalitolerans]
MSFIQIFSLILLVITFAVAIWRHVNVGLATIPAGFLLLLVAGVPAGQYFKQFPGELVILILGVAYLFGHAQRSGAIAGMTALAVRATGHRDWLLPWIMFLLAAVVSGIGALPAASLAIVVPIAMRTARERGINLMSMGLVTIMGALAGGFSPISVWGRLVVTLAAKSGRPISSLGLFAIEFVLNLALAVVAFLIFGGVRLIRRRPQLDLATGAGGTGGGAVTPDPMASGRGAVQVQSPVETAVASRVTAYQVCSLVGVAVFVAVVLIFSVDPGLVAFAVALVLQLLFRPDERELVRSLPWAVVLVITGVLLYVGLLEKIGTFATIAKHLGGIGSIEVAVLALAFVGSLFASFESSSVAVLGLVIPVAIGVTPGIAGTPLLLILCAVSWAIVVLSPSPYHLSGALVLASSPEDRQQSMLRKLLLWSVGVAVVVPALAWLIPTLAGL